MRIIIQQSPVMQSPKKTDVAISVLFTSWDKCFFMYKQYLSINEFH